MCAPRNCRVRCYSSLLGHIVTQLLTERTVFLMAAENKNHLSSDPDGHVFATVNTLGWEMWKFEEVSDGSNLFFVSSIEHDRALSCSSEVRLTCACVASDSL